jgi:hypothetical protein
MPRNTSSNHSACEDDVKSNRYSYISTYHSTLIATNNNTSIADTESYLRDDSSHAHDAYPVANANSGRIHHRCPRDRGSGEQCVCH